MEILRLPQTYQRAVFHVMTFATAQLANDRHVLDAVATDATAAATAVARAGNLQWHAHQPRLKVTEVTRLMLGRSGAD